MSIRWICLLLGVLGGLLGSVIAQAKTAVQVMPRRGVPYSELRTWHEQAMALGPTTEQKLEYLRHIVRNGTFGQRGLEHMFKDFAGSGAFDPATPGMEKNLRLTGSLNRSVALGAARNHLYAVQVQKHPEFTLLALDKPVLGISGKIVTDKDIYFQHRETGRLCRIESKDVRTDSQRADVLHYKRQIAIMAAEYRATGELQAYVNRREVIPELKAFARKLGVPVYENVVTRNRVVGSRQMPFDEVLNDIHRQAGLYGRTRLLASGGVTWASVWSCWPRRFLPSTRISRFWPTLKPEPRQLGFR